MVLGHFSKQLPLDNGRRPGQAGPKYDHQNQVASLDALGADSLIQAIATDAAEVFPYLSTLTNNWLG
jgi:hypothetical protein